MNYQASSKSFLSRLHPVVRGLARCAAVGVAATLISTPAQAAFHLWNIREIYSDASGSLQFIELFCTASGQNFLSGQSISVTPTGGGAAHTFTIPANISSATGNRALLFGTAGLQAAGAPALDYVLPASFLFASGGTISFFGANSGAYTALPTDGIMSRTWGGGNALNTPQNFAGQIGVVAVPEPGTLALFGLSALGFCFVLRRRSA